MSIRRGRRAISSVATDRAAERMKITVTMTANVISSAVYLPRSKGEGRIRKRGRNERLEWVGSDFPLP